MCLLSHGEWREIRHTRGEQVLRDSGLDRHRLSANLQGVFCYKKFENRIEKLKCRRENLCGKEEWGENPRTETVL